MIKAALRITHGSVRAFEREQELPEDSVRDVLRGRTVRRTAEAISKAIGQPVDVLFPGRFAPLRSVAVDNTSQNRDAHRQIAQGR